MSFIIYDIIFLTLFVLVTIIFLYINRKNLKRQGPIYLYPTKIGINFIDKFTNKYHKILRPLQYVVIASGYFLMGLVIWFLAKFTYFYLATPGAAKALKVPVLMPLVPYIDKIFNTGFLPPFYFTYWIIIIAVIAIPHEFAHGIFARLHKIKVHSTGFGFLGPFLAAFVEPDDKQMAKKSKTAQLAVLASGTFANVIFAIISALLIWVFFALAYSPVGVGFNTYSAVSINTSSASGIDLSLFNSTDLVKVNENNNSYYTTANVISQAREANQSLIPAYDDSPAFKNNLSGAIIEVNNQKVTSYAELSKILSSLNPGETVNIKTLKEGTVSDYNITLAEREGKAFLGIGLVQPKLSGFFVRSSMFFLKSSDPLKYNTLFMGQIYESNLGDFGSFIYNLLWWLVLINISVAIFNMVPAGMFDGGRFFFLTIWGITGSKKAGERAFKIASALLLALVIVLMAKWVFAFL